MNDFDALLWLEDKFFEEGYIKGFQEGISRAHIEGRLQGIEAGYITFLSVGRMQGRCDIWRSTLDFSISSSVTGTTKTPSINMTRIYRHLTQLEHYLCQLIKQINHSIESKLLLNQSKAKFKTLTVLLGEKSDLNEPCTSMSDIEDSLPQQP
ncbi:hypothetical protein PCANB_000491 [Pneumocystis canis]|nr:hypothetical protein PCK1_000484 [Pneumocystis canis]KAG5437778.1 hypothetical protein PCANB_000491 [Pneumocystis canis]